MDKEKTVARSFRFRESINDILGKTANNVGEGSDTVIVEMAIACYALEVGTEIKRARDFLYENLVARIAMHQMHSPRKKPVKKGKKHEA